MGLPCRHLAVIALAIAGCGQETSHPPGELVHVWRSQAPHLNDRSLEVQRDWLIFGTGRYDSDLHQLVRVEETPGRTATHYLLHYRGTGGEERLLGLLYRPGTPPTLQLDNRDEIWVREQDAGWLDKERS